MWRGCRETPHNTTCATRAPWRRVCWLRRRGAARRAVWDMGAALPTVLLPVPVWVAVVAMMMMMPTSVRVTAALGVTRATSRQQARYYLYAAEPTSYRRCSGTAEGPYRTVVIRRCALCAKLPQQHVHTFSKA
jgi:hypothetical protein